MVPQSISGYQAACCAKKVEAMMNERWRIGAKPGVVETCKIVLKDDKYKLAWYEEASPVIMINVTPFQMWLLISSLQAGLE